MSIEKSIQKLTNAITARTQIDLPRVRYTCKTISTGTGRYCECKTKNGCIVLYEQGGCLLDGFSDSVPLDRPCINGGTVNTHVEE